MRDQRSSLDVPLTVSLGKCESSLNGGTEYDGFEEYVRVLTIRLLANAMAEVSQQEGTFCVHSYSGRSFVVKTYGRHVKREFSLRFSRDCLQISIILL
jgi:hypothetical protein